MWAIEAPPPEVGLLSGGLPTYQRCVTRVGSQSAKLPLIPKWLSDRKWRNHDLQRDPRLSLLQAQRSQSPKRRAGAVFRLELGLAGAADGFSQTTCQARANHNFTAPDVSLCIVAR